MSNLPVIPVLIPLLAAVLLLFFKDKIAVQRWIGGAASLLMTASAVFLVWKVKTDGIQTLHMGGWAPPYGIVFVADMFAALLVLAASAVGAACLFYAFTSIGTERERMYFYPCYQFLLVGVTGSFLTGDMFNLFVFFEVMLISSYALIVLGGTKIQLQETLKYILINIVSSTLFVASVAYLYASVGTLNMAHLSQRIGELGQGGVLNVIAVLFLIVFALKAGLLLFFWLPGSYAAPPSAVRAVFAALLTKVGLYAIIRTFTLIFPYQPEVTHTLIGWMAAATMILGGIGAVAYSDIPRILNYNVVISVGFIAFGVAVGTKESLDGAVFYLLHDIVAKGLLFILGGMIFRAAGTESLTETGGLIRKYPLLGWMFLILALALVGVPPLSGFAGKVLLVRGGFEDGFFWLPLIGVASSFLVLYSLIRIFRTVFWGEEPRENAKMRMPGGMAVASVLLVVLIAMGIGSEGVYAFVSHAGSVLADPSLYIQAVMKE